MKALNNLLLIAAVGSALLFPYFFGHGLAVHEGRWYIYGAGFLLLSALLIIVHVRFARAATRREGHPSH